MTSAGQEVEREKEKSPPQVKADSGEAQQQMYPMVYTFAEADRLNGYASGMPYVNFYDQIWDQLVRSAKSPY